MTEQDNASKRVRRHMKRVPEHVRRMPEHMRRVPVKKAAKASGSFALWLSFLALILLCLAVSLGRWWAPVYVENNRQELLAVISEASGIELHSDDMTLVWSRWGPRLQLTGLSVVGENGEIPASLKKAQFSANVFKWLLLGKLIIDDVEVEGLHLDVLRSETGQWRLALSNEEQPQQQGRDWFEVLSRFRWLNLKDSVITFRDIKKQRQYVVDGVTVVANHFEDRYRISVDGDLPPHLGEKLKLTADLNGNFGDQLSGQLYLGLEEVNLSEVSSAFGQEKTRMEGRLAKLHYWQQLNSGKSTNGQLQFEGEHLQVQRSGDAEPWGVEVAELALGWERNDDQWDVWLDNLTLASKGQAWQSGYTRFKRSADGVVQAQGETLRLGSISLLLAQLSNIESIKTIAEAADQYNPRGDLVSWRLLLQPDQQGQLNTAFEGVISGLDVSSVAGRPGIQGLDALIKIRDNKLSARVNSADLRFEAPKLFDLPLQFDSVNGLVNAYIDPVNWWVRSSGVEFVSEGAQLETAFEVSKPAHISGLAINIKSNFQNVQSTQLAGFYPVGIMQPGLLKWLKGGIKKGQVTGGDFVFRGYSSEFPFRQGDGILKTTFEVEGLDLHYSPGWPAVTDANAEIEITSIGLNVAGKGDFEGSELQDFQLHIPDYRKGRILIETQMETTAENLRNFALTGPLSKGLAPHFKKLELEGPVRLKIAPMLALNKGESSTIEGSIRLMGNRVNVLPAHIDLTKVVGDVPFDQNGLKNATLTGELNGYPLKAQLKRLSGNAGMLIDARARMAPSTWLKERSNPLANYLDGVGNWRVLAKMLPDPNGGPGAVDISLTSDLKGVEIVAPSPLAKTKNQQRPFHIQGRIDSSSSSNWNFSLGQGLGGQFNLTGTGDLRSLALGASTPVPTLPQHGTRIRVDWARADVARWYDLVDECCLQGEGDGSYLDIYAQVAEAKWYGVPLGGGTMSIIDDESGLTGRVESRVVSGNFDYNYRVGEKAWDIDLQRVNLTPLVESELDENSSPPLDPSAVPITRWKIDNLQLSDINVQNIKINTSPVSGGMRVDRIIISTSDYTGNGKALWQLGKSGQHNSVVEMFLHASDLGGAVGSIGRANAITGGRGQVTLNLLWQDTLYKPDVATMSGDVKLEMTEGRINELDPGAGRLFGLLALQTLPQRLALDFSDLGEGLSYTQIKGEFELADGLAKTRYLLLEGPIGAISVAGDIDYVNQQFDQQIVVLPNVGGSLPVIGAVVGGPVTAAGVFLADKIFRSIGLDVDRFGRRDYLLKGSFDEPVLEQVVTPKGAGQPHEGGDR